MKLNKKLWPGVLTVIGLMVAAASADDHGNRNKVGEPGQEYLGRTYNELVSKWSNWLVKEPFATNPALDPDGRFCDKNQEGKVWFPPPLSGAAGSRLAL